ncbi:MAG: D-cysteine desulfhydrase family protein [Planctomycetia bacterium]|nr:D-cysteine desulfhydrase family protein [Planctomycetia bacterium]
MKLADIPRIALAYTPTPLVPLERLSAHLGGPRIFMKRDDQTGLALGGNKVRKLEFLLAEAIAQGCDTVVTTGGVQSNHARQTAAATAKLGLACELLLPRIVDRTIREYEASGNVLLDHLLGANVHLLPAESYKPDVFEGFVARLRAEGRKPYFIPTGGSTPVGALGYVVAIDELLTQAREQGVDITAIVVTTGSCGTHGGIVGGMTLAGHPARVLGISISGKADDRTALVRQRAAGALELLGERTTGVDERAIVYDGYVGRGYGQPTPAMVEAVRLTARLEGVLLDPVYTGKAMSGLIDLVRRGELTSRDTVVFWHTGGTPALFAYTDVFEQK